MNDEQTADQPDDGADVSYDKIFEEAGISDSDFDESPLQAEAAESVSEAGKESAETEAPATQDGPERDEQGRFKAKEPKDQEAPAEEPEGDERAEEKAQEESALISEAPSRFSQDAKDAWKDAPQAVRGEIQRAITELEGGLDKYRAQWEPFKKYEALAEQSGVSLGDAMGNYIEMEQLLRQDPQHGFGVLIEKLGMDPAQVGRQIAELKPVSPEVRQLNSELETTKRERDRLKQDQQNAAMDRARQEIAAFLNTPERKARFTELEGEITRQIQAGHDLATAYDIADRLKPAPQPAPRVHNPAANQSMRGVPQGSNPKPTPPKDRAEHIGQIIDDLGVFS